MGNTKSYLLKKVAPPIGCILCVYLLGIPLCYHYGSTFQNPSSYILDLFLFLAVTSVAFVVLVIAKCFAWALYTMLGFIFLLLVIVPFYNGFYMGGLEAAMLHEVDVPRLKAWVYGHELSKNQDAFDNRNIYAEVVRGYRGSGHARVMIFEVEKGQRQVIIDGVGVAFTKDPPEEPCRKVGEDLYVFEYGRK